MNKKAKPAIRPTDRPQREAYIERVSNKKSWTNKAEDLLCAASLLEPEVEKVYSSWKEECGISTAPSDELPETPLIRKGIVEVYFMLVGCAFENLLKGVLVRRLTRGKSGNRIIQPELRKHINTHDIFSLTEKLNIQLRPREADLLIRLEEIIVWRGRYPAPTEYSKIVPFRMETSDLTIAKDLVAKFKGL